MSDAPAAAETYRARAESRREREAGLRAIERRLSWGRLATFVAAAVLAWLPTRFDGVSAWWLLGPGLLFLTLVVFHARVVGARRVAERAAEHYERGCARLDGNWPGAGIGGEEFADPDHPYAADLDLFGSGSLFERLCLARTRAGGRTLARWLQQPAGATEIEARREAIEELAPRIDLGERLAVIGDEIAPAIDDRALGTWLQRGAPEIPVLRRRLAFVTSGLLSAALLGWAAGLPGFVVLIALAPQLALAAGGRDSVQATIAAVEHAGRRLDLLAGVLRLLEVQRFASPCLRAMQDQLITDGRPPSSQIRRLQRIVDVLDSRNNQLFAPLFGLLMLGTHLAAAAERWRVRHGAAAVAWLAAVGRFEALTSIAAYRYERPGDTFATLDPDGPRFVARGLGHPLLDEGACVRNDVTLDPQTRLLIVSGSNMSGKSTLLRAAGINTALGLTGAPVCARSLELSTCSLGASIHVEDSLSEGRSRFFAEILKLKRLTELGAERPPLLFLLDEILHGTNSHERRQGAAAVLERLLALGGIGLVTTHDLALAELGRDDPTIANVHFEDHLDARGELTFDYTLRPGVVRRGSALELMRSIGLEV